MTLETNAAVMGGRVLTHAPGVRLNNISELRLIFAASVMLSHAAALLDPGGYRLMRTVLNSEAAVQAFFILSGYLVCGSYSRIESPMLFYRRRLLRIYPAYAVAVVVFVSLGLAQAVLLGRQVAWGEVAPYLLANLTTLNFLQPSLNGVFAGNPIEVVNGALWSIKVEMMFYALLPPLYLVARRTSFGVLAVALILVGASWWPALTWAGERSAIAVPVSLKFQLPGQLHYFGLGMALFARSRGYISNAALVAVTGWTLLLLAGLGDLRQAIQVLVLVMMIGGVSALPQVKDVFAGQDISYGVYLAHFPLVQLLLAAGAGSLPFALYLALAVGFSVAYAFASWRLVERPALALGGSTR